MVSFRDEGCVVGVVMAGVSDGVLPHRGVPVYGRGEVWSILGNTCACGRVGSEDSLLENL